MDRFLIKLTKTSGAINVSSAKCNSENGILNKNEVAVISVGDTKLEFFKFGMKTFLLGKIFLMIRVSSWTGVLSLDANLIKH
ncbi:hypothetical protein RN001_001708 [Aquatica leii]|uniref:Uncharacterized protein n=1 Tax=Aquatica leii TaxID=1421715 RepID=A0AAN7SJP7_9COLE|nr:hypothetical protein RN001_001708 [Aquatica leii]